MVSMSSGLTPATVRLSTMTPAVSVIWPAVPVSIRISFLPVLTMSAVIEIGSTRDGRKGN
jgi:hypothetical protein